jgi:hypothetical protein
MSPDGATVLARSDKVLGAYDTESGMLRWQVRASDDEEWRVAVFSGDGQSLMIKGARSALIVSAASGETIKSIPLKPGSDGRLVLLNGEKYALGNEVYAVGERLRRTLPFRKPSESSRLPVASLSGRYLAGNLQSHEGDFAIVDVSREVVSTHKAEADRYVTLKQGLVTKAATFSPDSEMLAVSSDAQDYGRHPGELQLVSLKRERWSPIIPDRSSTGDFAVIPPDAHVVVKKETPSVRIFDSGGALLEGAGTGTFFSASVVFQNIDTLDNPGSPQTLAATQPLYKTWSYPGANLVIGLYGDQINQGAKGGSVLFDWATGKVSTGPGSVYSLYAVSPDGRQFASYDYDVDRRKQQADGSIGGADQGRLRQTPLLQSGRRAARDGLLHQHIAVRYAHP